VTALLRRFAALAAGALVFFFMGIFSAGASLGRLFSQEHLPVFTKTG
jgi:hypothetical protein